MSSVLFLEVAEDLESAGLVWHPEIGDEVLSKIDREQVSVLVDTGGMTPRELRSTFLWLPTVEQMVHQFEARQVILQHTGLELTTSNFLYKTVIKSPVGEISSAAPSLRLSFGFVLRELLVTERQGPGAVH